MNSPYCTSYGLVYLPAGFPALYTNNLHRITYSLQPWVPYQCCSDVCFPGERVPPNIIILSLVLCAPRTDKTGFRVRVRVRGNAFPGETHITVTPVVWIRWTGLEYWTDYWNGILDYWNGILDYWNGILEYLLHVTQFTAALAPMHLCYLRY